MTNARKVGRTHFISLGINMRLKYTIPFSLFKELKDTLKVVNTQTIFSASLFIYLFSFFAYPSLTLVLLLFLFPKKGELLSFPSNWHVQNPMPT